MHAWHFIEIFSMTYNRQDMNDVVKNKEKLERFCRLEIFWIQMVPFVQALLFKIFVLDKMFVGSIWENRHAIHRTKAKMSLVNEWQESWATRNVTGARAGFFVQSATVETALVIRCFVTRSRRHPWNYRASALKVDKRRPRWKEQATVNVTAS